MAWAHTNGKVGGNTVSGGSVATIATAAFSSALTNPSIIIVTVLYAGTTTSHVSSVTDTALNSYSRIDQGDDSTNSQAMEVWWAINNHTTASNVVTAHFSTNQTDTGIVADEFTGGGVSPTLDKHAVLASTHASPGPYAGTSVTPGSNGELIYGSIIIDTTASSNAFSANGSFAIGTQNNSATTGDWASEWFGQGTAAAVQSSFNQTLSGTVGFVTAIATIALTNPQMGWFTPFVPPQDNVEIVGY